MKKLFLFLVTMLTTVGVFAQNEQERASTVVYALIQQSGGDAAGADGSFLLAAYVGDETSPRVVSWMNYIPNESSDPTAGEGGSGYYCYELRIPTYSSSPQSNSDVGKPIRFVAVDQRYGFLYALNAPEVMTYQEDVKYGSAANPIVFSLNAPMFFQLTLNEVNKETAYTLADWLETGKEQPDMPINMAWQAGNWKEVAVDGGDGNTYPTMQFVTIDNVTVNNGVLTATDFSEDGGFILRLVAEGADWMQQYQIMAGEMSATENWISIVQHPTNIVLAQKSVETEKSPYGEWQMQQIFNGALYKPTIVPSDCTDQGTDEGLKVKWEVEKKDDPVLNYTDNGFTILKAGTARIRPYVEYVDRNAKQDPTSTNNPEGTIGTVKVYPKDANGKELWMTVKVIQPVDYIQLTMTGNDFRANLADENIYERLKNIVKVMPEDADNTDFHFETEDEGVTIANGKITVTEANSYTIKVVSEGKMAHPFSETGGPVDGEAQSATAYVRLRVLNPVTKITFTENPIAVPVTREDETVDITARVYANINYNGGNPADNFEETNKEIGIDVTSGTSVMRTEATANTNYPYSFTAKYVEGNSYSTITLTVSYIEYNRFLDPSKQREEELQKTVTFPFEVYVQKHNLLERLYATYDEPVAGKDVVITLEPSPANAEFTPGDVELTFEVEAPSQIATVQALKKIYDAWASQALSSDRISATQESIKWKLNCELPGYVKISAKLKGNATSQSTAQTDVPIWSKKDNTELKRINLGYDLVLNENWQWRCNPWGLVTPGQIKNVYGAKDLEEIRTSGDLLFNENSSLYGSLLNTDGIRIYECYKVKMANPHEAVIYGEGTENLKKPDNVEIGTNGIVVKLNKGWNWVGCPYFFNRAFDKVMSLMASQLPDGMMVLSKFQGFMQYKKNSDQSGTWEGQNAFFFRSGQGYLVYNPGDILRLNFPAEYQWEAKDDDADQTSSVKEFGMGGKLWKYDHSKFMNNMALISVLDGVEDPENYSIGAFVGDECRGESFVQNGKMFITVHCDAGEYVKFKLYNTLTDETTDIVEGVRAQQCVGSLRSPFLMHATATGINGINGDENTTESFDLAGRRISGQQRGVNIQRTANGTRKVVVK